MLETRSRPYVRKFRYAGRDIPIALSLGTASWPEEGTAAEALIATADEAMYVDKRRQKAAKAIAASGMSAAEKATAGRLVPSA